MQPAGSAARNVMVGGVKESSFLRRLWKDCRAVSKLGERSPDRDDSYVLSDGARDEPGKIQGDGVHPRINLGEGGGDGLQETGDGRRGNLQRAEEVRG